MTAIENILGSMRDALARTSGSLRVDDPDFAGSLRLGQIVKGRVTRHYEEGRYAMDFGGREKVVDSSMPLRVSELVTARVVSVGEQVHLQRLQADGEAAKDLAESARLRPAASRHHQLVQEVFDRYNVTLSAQELEALAAAVRRAPNAALMSLCALVLHKVGTAPAPELLQAVYRRLDAAGAADAPPKLGAALRLVAEPAESLELSGAALEPLAARLQALAAEPASTGVVDPGAENALAGGEGDGGAASEGDDRQPEGDARWLLGQWLLNAQSHPRIAHRLVRLPLWLGDRLVEVSMALFSEGEAGRGDGIRFGHAVLFLEMDRLGKVQVTLNAADRSLRLAVAAEDEGASDILARYAAPLRAALEGLEWQVAEVQYLQMELSEEGAVLDTIVHHHITQDSLSRWM